MTKRAVLYARVSSDDTHNEGRNVDGQLDMCRQYAIEHACDIVAELAEDDHGASGAALELPQLDRVRDMAGRGEFDVLIVREIDRLSRSLPKQLIVEEELRRAGVSIAYVLGDYPDTPEGNLMKNLRASIAEFERLKIQERMARGAELKVKAGSTMFQRRPPFGYREVEKGEKWTLEVVEAEAAVVRMIFELYVGGENGQPLSLHGLARKLTELGVPTPTDMGDIWPTHHRQRGYANWSKGTLSKTISYEVYAGVAIYGRNAKTPKVARPVAVPAIVSRELWERAQVQRSENVRLAKRNARRDYLFSGFLACGHCGSNMAAHTSIYRYKGAHRDMTYYHCLAAEPGTRAPVLCDLHAYFRADFIEEKLWGWVTGFLFSRKSLEQGLADYRAELEHSAAPIRGRLSVLNDLLAHNRAQMGRLLDLYLSGDFPKELLTDRKASIEATVAVQEKERGDLIASLENTTLSEERIATIAEFAAQAAQGLKIAGDDVQARRALLRALAVSGVLTVEDGERVLYVKCALGQVVLPIAARSVPG